MLWTEGARDGAFRAVVEVAPRQTYEFILVAIGNCDADTITGLWDVMRNGVQMCKGCVGQAYGLSQSGARNYFKVYIGDPLNNTQKWHFSGYISGRHDF